MIKKIIFFLFLYSFGLFLFPSHSRAEVVLFREGAKGQVPSFCYPTSLNETITVKMNSTAGPGVCNFSADVVGGGEWTNTGGFFDSPPYAWGADEFYPFASGLTGQIGASFTCSQPTYTLDTASLPSYVTITKSEPIPGQGTLVPNGVRYFFAVNIGNGETIDTSFTAKFTLKTNCDFKTDQYNGTLHPVAIDYPTCSDATDIDINPRTKSIDYPIQVSTSLCGKTTTPTPSPSSTPKVCNSTCNETSQCASGLSCIDVGGGDKRCRFPGNPGSSTCQPTPSVTPTPTKIPSPTPTPTKVPTPTPTPFPFSEAMCKCDGIELSPKNFTSGSTLTVTAYAKVEGGDTSYANVSKMRFSSGSGVDPNIKRDIPYEVPIAVSIVEQTPTKVRYKSTWQYKVPGTLDPKLTYRIWADPVCVRKQATGPVSVQTVAGASTEDTGGNFFTAIFGFFTRLFGGSSNTVNTSQKIQSQETATPIPEQGEDTLQLGTLNQGEVVGTDNCRYIKIRAK